MISFIGQSIKGKIVAIENTSSSQGMVGRRVDRDKKWPGKGKNELV